MQVNKGMEIISPRCGEVPTSSAGVRSVSDVALYVTYALALAVSISLWFLPIRAPLWLDETGSYWQISAGFSQIWARQFVSFPAYSYILWFSTKILGTSEIALRIPSVLAMLGAVYLLYLAARELFDRDLAIIAIIIFCVNPIVVFRSIDVRPYGFAALATAAAILILLRLRYNDSNWLAALFGFSAACIIYFQYLFAVILPALLLCYFVVKTGDRKTLWRQLGIASAVLALAFLPVTPGLRLAFLARGTHVYFAAPKLGDLAWTLAPGWLPFVFVGVALIALITAALTAPRRSLTCIDGKRIFLCLSLALIPALLLYGVSVWTSIHIFARNYRLIAIPGIALSWALIIDLFRSRTARLAFCVALVSATSFTCIHAPDFRRRLTTWKYALAIVERSASADNAPVLICSSFIESNYASMPLDSPKESFLLAPLSYYTLSVPVVPLPMALNDEAIRVASQFLNEASQKHERFLAMGDPPSYKTLDWLTQYASGFYDVHKLGVFDQIELLEFIPRVRVSAHN